MGDQTQIQPQQPQNPGNAAPINPDDAIVEGAATEAANFVTGGGFLGTIFKNIIKKPIGQLYASYVKPFIDMVKEWIDGMLGIAPATASSTTSPNAPAASAQPAASMSGPAAPATSAGAGLAQAGASNNGNNAQTPPPPTPDLHTKLVAFAQAKIDESIAAKAAPFTAQYAKNNGHAPNDAQIALLSEKGTDTIIRLYQTNPDATAEQAANAIIEACKDPVFFNNFNSKGTQGFKFDDKHKPEDMKDALIKMLTTLPLQISQQLKPVAARSPS